MIDRSVFSRGLRHAPRVALLAALAVLALSGAQAQPDLSRRVGTTVADTGAPGYRFESFVLSSRDGRRRYRIHVAVPLGRPPARGFPSAFLLDGNAALMEVDAGLLAALAEAPRPPVVVFIGYDDDLRINATNRAFDYTPRRPGGDAVQTDTLGDRRTGGAADFLALLTDTVLLRVASLVPLDRERQSLWGHSYGGLFALHVLFTQPQAFDRYIAVDPSLWWGEGQLLEEQRRAPAPPPGVSVQMIVGDDARTPSPRRARSDSAVRRAREAVPADAALQMARRLRESGLEVDYRSLPGHSHGATLGGSLPIMLRDIAEGR